MDIQEISNELSSAEQEYQSGSLHPEGVIVDAMIGTGLKTQLRPEYQNAVEAWGPSKPTQTHIAPVNANPLPGYQGNAADLPTLQRPYLPTTARKEPLGREAAYKPEPLPLPGLQGRTTGANNYKCCNSSLFRDYSRRVRLKEKNDRYSDAPFQINTSSYLDTMYSPDVTGACLGASPFSRQLGIQSILVS